ncbi:MAG: DNA-directed RNA polymerase [Thermoplasmata archaeon]
MYMLVDDEDVLRIPPEMLGGDIDQILFQLSREKLEGKVRLFEEDTKDNKKYVIIAILSLERIGDGRIIPGDGGVYQRIKFEALTFKPELQEVIEGNIVEVKEFGAFVRFGALDGLLHISQIFDDRFDIDIENKRLIGKESKKDLRLNDRVRVRFVSLSLNEDNVRESKVGLTMRQPGLGKLDYLEKEAAKNA